MSKRASLLFVAALAAALSASVASAQEKAYKVGYIADLSGPMQDNYGTDPRRLRILRQGV